MAGVDQNRTAELAFVYALGQIEHRFPSLGLEKEFAQATGRADTTGYRDRQAAHVVLAERQNRYLARHLCWVFQVEGLDAYIIQPRDPMDFEMLIEALSRPISTDNDVDVVIGTRKILDVIFSYTHRQTDTVDKRFVRVDVTDMFPFLVTKLSNFYER